jgi:hypothetical protein
MEAQAEQSKRFNVRGYKNLTKQLKKTFRTIYDSKIC